jgi:hypothetical protein
VAPQRIRVVPLPLPNPHRIAEPRALVKHRAPALQTRVRRAYQRM